MLYAAILRVAAAVAVVTGSGVVIGQAMAEDASKPQQAAQQTQAGRPARIWGEEKAGLACSISAEKMTYHPGESIPVRFDLKNVSDKPLTVWHCGFWPNHRWIVQDTTGKDLKLTAHGRLCRDCYGPNTPRRKNAPFVVQPGKTDASFGPYDLRKHFEIPDGITIHVRCVYLHSADGQGVKITSNTLPLTVELPSFSFSTGGRYHIEGYGEWVVTLTDTGVMSVTHCVRDTEKRYGPYTLNQRERADLNALVQRAESSGLESSTRTAVPDSVKWTVSFKRTDASKTYRIWEQDARRKLELRQLAARLGTLVRTHTKQRPVGFPNGVHSPGEIQKPKGHAVP